MTKQVSAEAPDWIDKVQQAIEMAAFELQRTRPLSAAITALDTARKLLDKSRATLPSAGDACELMLCEIRHLALKPDQLYIFRMAEDCLDCQSDARNADVSNPSPPPPQPAAEGKWAKSYGPNDNCVQIGSTAFTVNISAELVAEAINVRIEELEREHADNLYTVRELRKLEQEAYAKREADLTAAIDTTAAALRTARHWLDRRWVHHKVNEEIDGALGALAKLNPTSALTATTWICTDDRAPTFHEISVSNPKGVVLVTNGKRIEMLHYNNVKEAEWQFWKPLPVMPALTATKEEGQ